MYYAVTYYAEGKKPKGELWKTGENHFVEELQLKYGKIFDSTHMRKYYSIILFTKMNVPQKRLCTAMR